MAAEMIFPRTSPEAEGIVSAGVLAFLEAADETIHDLHSFMLLRHGRVVAEGWWYPYAPDYPHTLYSLSKSFVSTAIGLAAAEGRLSVDDAVITLLPDDRPLLVNEQQAALRVRHLLTMTSGHDPETEGLMFRQPEGNWAKGFLSQPMIHPPGTHFTYENGATYMLSAIVQQVTGMTVLDYLQPRLFAPLGIDKVTWSVGPRGINIGFTGLSLTTEAIARFGQLYLQKGVWQGKQLLPTAWVEAATKRQVSNGANPDVDEEQGYGYQFWRIRYGAYRGDGAFGQFCEMWPEHDVVLAITGGKEGMEVIQDLIWEHLLPATRPRALPTDDESQQALYRKLSRLSIAVPQGQPLSPLATQISQRTYDFRAHEQNPTNLHFDFGHGPFFVTFATITFDFTVSSAQGDGCICTIVDNRASHEVVCGHGHWRMGTTTVNSTDGHTLQPVAASGAWTADDTYEMQWCFVETAFRTTLICRFEEERITVDWHENARFGEVKSLQLLGRVVMLS